MSTDTDSTGLYGELDVLDVLILTDLNDTLEVSTDDITYTGLIATGVAAEFVGVPEFVLRAWNGVVKYNTVSPEKDGSVPNQKVDRDSLAAD